MTAADVPSLRREDFVAALKTGGGHAIVRPSLSYWQDAWLRLRKKPE